MKIEIIHNKHPLLGDVMILGKKHASSLGFFPQDAFIEHARKRWIFGATADGKLLGYLLFRINQGKQVIVITHLCIRPENRGAGISQQLIDQLKKRYGSELSGIALSCREDYVSASKLWTSYGFQARGRIRSRSKEENYLLKWYLDFGRANLFSEAGKLSHRTSALLDCNILVKLRDRSGSDSVEVEALLADWLADEVDFYYAPEIFTEIHRDRDKDRADKTRSLLQHFQVAQFSPEDRSRIVQELAKFIHGDTDNDHSDRLQLAECIAAKIEHFITLDERVLNHQETLIDQYGVRVLRPSELILLIDQTGTEHNYRSLRMAGARYEYSAIGADLLEELCDHLWLDSASGEKRHQLRQRLAAAAADVKKSVLRLVRDTEGSAIGYFVGNWSTGIFKLIALRIRPGRIANVLLQQMVRDIILLAVDLKIETIEVLENFLNEEQKRILLSFGFVQREGRYRKVNLSGLHTFSDLIYPRVAEQQFEEVKIAIERMEAMDSARQTFVKLALERRLWPVKFADLDIPTYIVPIRPHWASQLFDHYAADNTLFGADPHISWNRENVYYRSVLPVMEEAPARILWYVSMDPLSTNGRASSIVACSYLQEVHVSTAKLLFKQFKYYGVYEWNHIFELAGGNPEKEIKALKFTDTETFRRPIPFQLIKRIFREMGRPENTFASPVKVSPAIFNRIYLAAKSS